MTGARMTDRGADGLLTSLLRRERLRRVRPYLVGKVLDYGGGAGALAQYVLPEHYHGMEPDPPPLAKARSRVSKHRVSSHVAEAASIDTVVALAVVEHVENPSALLAFLSRCLGESRDARLVLTTPHPSFRRFYDAGANLYLFSRKAIAAHVR